MDRLRKIFTPSKGNGDATAATNNNSAPDALAASASKAIGIPGRTARFDAAAFLTLKANTGLH